MKKIKGKKILSLVLAAALLLTLCLAGCGSSSSSTGSTTSADSGTDSSSSAAASAVGEEATDEWGTYTKLTDDVEPITLVYGGNGGLTSITWAASAFLKELLETRSDGKITLDVHENSTIASSPIELYESVLTGDIDLCNGSPGTTFLDELAACDVPMLFTDWDTAWELWTEGDFHDLMAEMFEEDGVLMLWASPKAYRDYHGNVELTSVADLKGVTIRLPGNTFWVAFWSALGASPQYIAMSEVYTALSQGTVDAGENAHDQILNNNLMEVSDYLIFTHHYLDTMALFMNPDSYNNMDPQIQTLFDQCMEVFADWAEVTVPEYRDRDEADLVEAAEAAGATVLEISDSFKEELTEAAWSTLDDVRAVSDRASQLLDYALDAFGYDY